MLHHAGMSPKEVTYAARSQRFREWLKKKNLTPAEVARRITNKHTGEPMSRAYLTGLANGKRQFGENAARMIESELRMPEGYLDQKEDDRLEPIIVWSKPDDLPQGSHVLVPRVTVALSAGSGTLVSREDQLPPLAFTEEWIRSKNVTSRENLRVCKVSGDSMEPYLEDNDSVLIDMGQTTVHENKVYAIEYAGEVRVKRLSRSFNGGLRIKSDNARDYPEESLTPEQAEHLRILGKVIWRAG